MARKAKARRTDEQGRARTYDELRALGERRGYADPEAWARRVLWGREKRREKYR